MEHCQQKICTWDGDLPPPGLQPIKCAHQWRSGKQSPVGSQSDVIKTSDDIPSPVPLNLQPSLFLILPASGNTGLFPKFKLSTSSRVLLLGSMDTVLLKRFFAQLKCRFGGKQEHQVQQVHRILGINSQWLKLGGYTISISNQFNLAQNK